MKKAVSVDGHAEEAEKMYVQKEEKHFFLFLFCHYVNGEFESTSLRFPFFCSPRSQNINILPFYETLSMKIFHKTKVTPWFKKRPRTCLENVCLPKTLFSNLFTELSVFNVYSKITVSLLITISQSLNAKTGFPIHFSL